MAQPDVQLPLTHVSPVQAADTCTGAYRTPIPVRVALARRVRCAASVHAPRPAPPPFERRCAARPTADFRGPIAPPARTKFIG